MDSGKNFIIFWLKNSGLVLPLAIYGLFKWPKVKRWFFLPPLIIFILANVVVFQPWDWDNIKLFSWVFLFLSLPAAAALVHIARFNLVTRLLAAVIFISLTLSGILSLLSHLPQKYVIYDNEGIELAKWIQAHTPKSSVFLIDPQPTHPVAGLSGRSVYLGYPGHLWVHGLTYGPREEKVKSILAGNLNMLTETEVKIDYLVVEANKKDPFSKLTPIYINQKYVVYRVSPSS